jgi:hypothetical protein
MTEPLATASAAPLTTQRPTRAGALVLRSLGVLAAGSGLYECSSCVVAIIRDGHSWAGWIVLVSSLLIAIWCLVSAYRAWRPTASPPVASVSAIAALFILVCALQLVHWLHPEMDGVRTLTGFLLASAVELLCLAIYITLAWWLAVALAVPEHTRRIPPLAITLACLSAWLVTSELLNRTTHVVPLEEPSFAHSLLHIGLPIVAAVAVYRLLLRIEPRPKFGAAHPDAR